MKKIKKSVVILVFISVSLFVYILFPRPPVSLSSFDKRAVWFSYIDLNKFSYESQDAFQKDFSSALDNVIKYKTNTVIVQIRPFEDALYKSELFPVSQTITQKTSLSFDPLQTMIDLAHEKGLSIEAWINPYRVSHNEQTYQQFTENSSKKAWIKDTKQVINYGENEYILNPASQDVRNYIVDGVKEVVSNYDIDGIHFDDYFYVQGTHGDTSKNQRLDYVNMLVSDVYSTIKKIKPKVTFGISPQGNYENCIDEGADIDTWLKEEGYVDYVMPQVYWTDQYGSQGEEMMFTNRVQTFAGLKRHKSVILYAGLALYRVNEDSTTDIGWKSSQQNMSDQIQVLSLNGYDGYSFFSYSSLVVEAGQKEMDTVIKIHS